MPELRENVAALREGGEMPEDWTEQLRDFYLPACLNCGAISDFEFTTAAFGGLCGLASQKWRAPTETGGVLWGEESGLRRSSSARRCAWR